MVNFNKTIVSIFSDLYEKYNYNNMNSDIINYYIDNLEDSKNRHSSEIEGLKSMYNYICSDEINNSLDNNVVRTLHETLYSKVPFPEVGGTYRNHPVYIEQGNIELCPHYEINHLLSILNIEIEELHKISYVIKGNKNINDVLAYTERCINVLCKLIYICPFNDGNERVARGIVNKLLMDVGIAPVFVRSEDKKEYVTSIKKAIIERDYSDINNFYLSKSSETMNLLNMGFGNKSLKKIF